MHGTAARPRAPCAFQGAAAGTARDTQRRFPAPLAQATWVGLGVGLGGVGRWEGEARQRAEGAAALAPLLRAVLATHPFNRDKGVVTSAETRLRLLFTYALRLRGWELGGG